MSFEEEVKSRRRFQFGKNWARFLRTLNDARIDDAVESLKRMLDTESLEGKSFLDVGSGSGLFSLAARKLGATVTSYDYDPGSVACTSELKRRYFDGDQSWTITMGSILDDRFVDAIGAHDIVYSWGVLHHTGAMWKALDNVRRHVAPGGKLFIAIYNRQPVASTYWLAVKKLYNRMPPARPLLIGMHIIYPVIPSFILKTLSGRKPPRGMAYWYDLLDWLGGYPFEVAKPEEIIIPYYKDRFILTNMKTVGGRLGCNEFVFERS